MGNSGSTELVGDHSLTGSSSGRSNSALVETGVTHVYRHPACKFLTYIRTLFGMITAIVVYWVGIITLIYYREIPISIFLLFIGMPVILLEFGGFIRVCCGTDGACCRFFSIVLGLDHWGRAIFYTLIGAVCLMPDVIALPFKVAGGCLLTSAALYFAKSFQLKKVKMFMLHPESHNSPLPNQQSPQPNAEATIYNSTSS